MLYGRDAEVAEVDRLIARAREGRSGVLVIRGEAGIGKSALLEYAGSELRLAGQGRVLRGLGIESEVALPFAALHLLLRSAVHRIDALPVPQADALRGAFGLARASVEDRFLVGVAVLSLLTELAAEGPLLCLVDDAQWLDQASAEALMFASRRLHAEGVVVIFAVRDDAPGFDASGLPELWLRGLDRTAAVELLAPHHLPWAARERLLDEAGGNPLALLELPAALMTEHSGDPLEPLTLHVRASSPPGRVQAAFERQIDRLPYLTQTLLVIAAAEGSGELAVIVRAGRRLGAQLSDLEPAEQARLIELEKDVLSFRHPLVRAAAYRSATAVRRLAAHRALAGSSTRTTRPTGGCGTWLRPRQSRTKLSPLSLSAAPNARTTVPGTPPSLPPMNGRRS